jgi:hypothetical protein
MDLHGYKRFIESCPTIATYVTITEGTVLNGFVYNLHNFPKQSPKATSSSDSHSLDCDKEESTKTAVMDTST